MSGRSTLTDRNGSRLRTPKGLRRRTGKLALSGGFRWLVEVGSPGRNRTYVACPDSKSGGPCQQTNRGTAPRGPVTGYPCRAATPDRGAQLLVTTYVAVGYVFVGSQRRERPRTKGPSMTTVTPSATSTTTEAAENTPTSAIDAAL